MKNEITGTKFRLIVMNFLQFAVWGAYLTSMGTYLYNIGLGEKNRSVLCYARHCVIIYAGCYGNHCRPLAPAQKAFGILPFYGSCLYDCCRLLWNGIGEIIRSLCPFYSVLFQCGILYAYTGTL